MHLIVRSYQPGYFCPLPCLVSLWGLLSAPLDKSVFLLQISPNKSKMKGTVHVTGISIMSTTVVHSSCVSTPSHLIQPTGILGMQIRKKEDAVIA